MAVQFKRLIGLYNRMNESATFVSISFIVWTALFIAAGVSLFLVALSIML